MRLAICSITTAIGEIDRLGVLQDGHVVDVNAAYRARLEHEGSTERAAELADCLLPPNMTQYLRGGRASREALEAAVEFAANGAAEAVRHDIGDVRLRAPLTPTSMREFSVTRGHMTRGGTRELPKLWYELPTYFKGMTSSTIGTEEEIPWPSFTERLDYELEIAAVIGRSGSDIPEDDAYDYIAGFTIFNDVSTRDMQAIEREMGHGPAKSKDFCNVLGPCITTSDETNGLDLAVAVKVNGETVVESRYDDAQFNWAQLVAHVSRDEVLSPGDVLSSGVVTGCAGVEQLGWPTEGPILAPGDLIEFEVEKIGVLRNRVAARRNG